MPSPQMIEVKETYEASFQFISAGAHSVPIPSLDGQGSWRLYFDAASPIPIEGARDAYGMLIERSSNIKFGLRWHGVATDGMGKVTSFRVMVSPTDIHSHRPDKYIETYMDGQQFPFASSGTIEVEGVYAYVEQMFKVTAVLQLSMPVLEDETLAKEHRKNRAFTDIHSSQHVNDVRLYFPSSGRELWANSTTLSSASPYFRTLLASDFTEGIAQSRGEHGSEPSESKLGNVLECDDSDQDSEYSDPEQSDEEAMDGSKPVKEVVVGIQDAEGSGEAVQSTDETMVKSTSEPSSVLKDDTDVVACPFPYRQIVINSAHYKTYRAVLHWIQTSQINLAPLLSSFQGSDDPSSDDPEPSSGTRTISAGAERRAQIDQMVEDLKLDDFARPISPKSLYRLAHFLELPILAKLSLSLIKSQLSVENVALEFFGDLSAAYPEVRAVELEFVLAHWKEIKVSGAMKEVERRVEAGNLPSYVSASLELVKKL